MDPVTCPACGYQNPTGSTSCQRCLIVFEKYQKRKQTQPQTNAQGVVSTKKLDEMWQDVLASYNDLNKHEKLIQEALKDRALPFVSQLYRKMIELNPADDIAIKMRDKIINVATLTYIPPIRPEPPKSNNRVMVKVFFFLIAFVLLVLVGQVIFKR